MKPFSFIPWIIYSNPELILIFHALLINLAACSVDFFSEWRSLGLRSLGLCSLGLCSLGLS